MNEENLASKKLRLEISLLEKEDKYKTYAYFGTGIAILTSVFTFIVPIYQYVDTINRNQISQESVIIDTKKARIIEILKYKKEEDRFEFQSLLNELEKRLKEGNREQEIIEFTNVLFHHITELNYSNFIDTYYEYAILQSWSSFRKFGAKNPEIIDNILRKQYSVFISKKKRLPLTLFIRMYMLDTIELQERTELKSDIFHIRYLIFSYIDHLNLLRFETDKKFYFPRRKDFQDILGPQAANRIFQIVISGAQFYEGSTD